MPETVFECGVTLPHSREVELLLEEGIPFVSDLARRDVEQILLSQHRAASAEPAQSTAEE